MPENVFQAWIWVLFRLSVLALMLILGYYAWVTRSDIGAKQAASFGAFFGGTFGPAVAFAGSVRVDMHYGSSAAGIC